MDLNKQKKIFSNGIANSQEEQDCVLLQNSNKECVPSKEHVSNCNKWKKPSSVWALVAAVYLIYTAYGMNSGTEGPSLPEMEHILNTTTKDLSLGLLGKSVGFLVGCCICGLTFDKGAHDLQLGLTGILMAVAAVLPPFSGTVAGYFGTLVFKGITFGIMCPGAQTYILMLLTGHKLQGSALQALNLIWSAGGIISPFIIQAFMSNEGSTHNNRLNNTNISITPENISTGYNERPAGDLYESQIGIAFITMGGITFLLAIPLLLLSFVRMLCRYNLKQSYVDKESKSGKSKPSTFKGSKYKFYAFLAMLVLWFKSYIWTEILMSHFLATWVNKQLSWTMKMGSLLTSGYFAFHCAGRVMGVILAAKCTPRQMLIACASLTTTGYLSLLILYRFHFVLVWISVAITALGTSCSFASMMLWASGHIHITGRISVIFLLGNSAGKLSVSPLTGSLMEMYSPDWMLFLGIGASVCGLILIFILEIFVHLIRNKRKNRTC